MSSDNKAELLRLLEEKALRIKYNYSSTLFPDEGPNRRELYKKHLEFFKSGATYKERAFIAANRIGKTSAILYEVSLHLTGIYPSWWEGRRFKKPPVVCCVGVTNVQTTGVLQEKLLGRRSDMGTGMVAKEFLGKHLSNPGSPDALVSCEVKHISGGWSKVIFKSYQHEVDSFQGYEFDLVVLDEEPPPGRGHYSECLTRTMTTQGSMVLSCTPLKNRTDLILSFLPGGCLPPGGDASPWKHTTIATWDDVPHLTEEEKENMYNSYLPHEREARSKGIPGSGAGSIYPVDESKIYVEPFRIPDYWPKGAGMDVGWNRTAAIWGALDPESDTLYLYREHYMGKELPSTHSTSLLAKDPWITFAIDPASQGSGQADGKKLFEVYAELGLELVKANNALESGILEVFQRMCDGRLKIFNHLQNLQQEIRMYYRDENGKIADKQQDHACDAMRYLVNTLDQVLSTDPGFDVYTAHREQERSGSGINGDSTRNKVTGY